MLRFPQAQLIPGAAQAGLGRARARVWPALGAPAPPLSAGGRAGRTRRRPWASAETPRPRPRAFPRGHLGARLGLRSSASQREGRSAPGARAQTQRSRPQTRDPPLPSACPVSQPEKLGSRERSGPGPPASGASLPRPQGSAAGWRRASLRPPRVLRARFARAWSASWCRPSAGAAEPPSRGLEAAQGRL